MFGEYDYIFHCENGDIQLGTERNGSLLTYRRTCGRDTFERILASESGSIIVNPVEPVNLPKEVTNYLQVEFDPIVIEPGGTQKIYLKIPIEIGVFLDAMKDLEVLDIFCSDHQKYTLYGPPSGGVIARWCLSHVYGEIPPLEPFREGVIELTIRNTHREWVKVAYAVFESCDMKIYYGDVVAMVAQMKILNKHMAETDFVDLPLLPGMRKSVELYTARNIPVIRKGFLMEWGLS
jgi:uncharacterized protein